MRVKLIGGILVVALLLALLYWYTGRETEFFDNSSGIDRQGPPVNATKVKAEDFVELVASVGTAEPSTQALVRNRVAGVLQKFLVKEGEKVKAGQVLAQIEPNNYQLQLNKAKGSYQQVQSQLASAKTDLIRYQNLFKQDAISRQELEDQTAKVTQLQAGLAQVNADLDNAKLEQSYTQIKAPISGQLGLRRADEGNLLNAGDIIFSIVQTQPMLVQFSVAEQTLPSLRKAMVNNPVVEVQAWDRSNKILLATGKLINMDNQIDVATGSIKLRAEFANSDNELFSNQFINIKMILSRQNQAILLPIELLQYDAQGSYVYLYDSKEKKAKKQPIKLGAKNFTQVVVEQGLKLGDLVIFEGVERVMDGHPVSLVAVDGELVAKQDQANNQDKTKKTNQSTQQQKNSAKKSKVTKEKSTDNAAEKSENSTESSDSGAAKSTKSTTAK